MIRLFLRDASTGIKVEHDFSKSSAWNLKDAVGELTKKIAKETERSPEEVLFTSPPFEIIVLKNWE